MSTRLLAFHAKDFNQVFTYFALIKNLGFSLVTRHDGNKDLADNVRWYLNSYPSIHVNLDSKNVSGYLTSRSNPGTEVSFDQLVKLTVESTQVVTEVSVKLNDQYTAVVSKTGIVVGCQTFSLESLAKLTEALEKIKAK